jgi:hypothetical protein
MSTGSDFSMSRHLDLPVNPAVKREPEDELDSLMQQTMTELRNCLCNWIRVRQEG